MEVDLHMHSRHSNDSRSRTELLVERAIAVGLGGIAVTDHNSWAGAREAAKIAQGRIIVIPGAEIKTDKGDVLALFLSEEIASRDFGAVIDKIRSMGGISIVPHPADSPKITTEHLKMADGIEMFNSTCTPGSNQRNARIASELGKPAFSSSDAHLVREVGNGRTRVPDCKTVEELREQILKSPVPARTEQSNLVVHRANAIFNFGIKGMWRR